MKKIDIVIPTYKPENEFRELLLRLKNQRYQANKIIIINTDKQFFDSKLCEDIDNIEVKHIAKQDFDHGATRDMAFTLSDADYLMFMTQDALPQNDELITSLVNALESDSKIAVAYARQMPRDDCNFVEKYTRNFNYPEHDIIKTESDIEKMGIKTFFCSDVCSAYSIKLYHELGGFVSPTIFNEDMIFAAKAIRNGYKVYYSSKASVVHSHNYGAMAGFHRNFDLGVSQSQYHETFDGVKSEDEGIKLVKKTMSYLWKSGKGYLIPDLIVKSGFKFIGFRLGKKYKKLPMWMVKKCTSNIAYWEK